MAALTVAVVVLSLVTLFNTVALFALVRRVREGGAGAGNGGALPAVGSTVGTLSARTLAGGVVTGSDLAAQDDALVALLSGGCGACEEIAAALRAGFDGLAPEQVYAFVLDTDEAATRELTARLGDAITVAVVGLAEVRAAFAVNAFPTLLRLRRGRVAAAGHILAEVVARPVATRG